MFTHSRLAAAALLTGLLGSFGLASGAQAEPERAADGAVVVRASGAVMDGIGAGTIVAVTGSSVTVLTAKHVADIGPLTLKFADGTKAEAKITSEIAGRDLALVTADVDPTFAATLHVAPVAAPKANLPVHVWGSGVTGPAFEPAAIDKVGAVLPDGAIHDRYTLHCALCHEGDSGAGVFDARGNLVGVFVGYFEMSDGRLGVAEEPLTGAALAAAGVPSATVAHASVPTATNAPGAPSDSAAIVAATFAR
jgi:hypothetical protein